MSAEKPFEGDFLFVNHNAKQMKASAHRKRVFSHVQNKYRNWKRQEDNRALRASIKTSLSETQPRGKVDEARATRRLPRTKDVRSLPVRSPQATTGYGGAQVRRIPVRSLITEDGPEATESAVVGASTKMLLAR